jgi:hypothetical protein
MCATTVGLPEKQKTGMPLSRPAAREYGGPTLAT